MGIISFLQNPLFIISAIFWIISFILIKVLGKKKENITLMFPFLIMFRTKVFNKFFQKISRKYNRFWKIIWNIGIIGSFILMLFALYFFISNLIILIIQPQVENALIPLIPGVTISLPMFSEFLLPLLITISVHECSHAIAAEIDGIEVKSSGIFGAGVFFIIGYGAFVEVDEFQLYSKKYKSETRLRVAAAGVWANIMVALLCFILLNFFSPLMKLSYGAQTFQVEEVLDSKEGGFNQNNIFSGDIIFQINGTNVDQTKGKDLGSILANETRIKCSIGDKLIFKCYEKDFRETYNRTVQLGFKSYIGFSYEKFNNSAFKITSIDDWQEGGNNYQKMEENMIITYINNKPINYEQNQTLGNIVTQKRPDYKLNLTNSQGKTFEINVNYPPLFPGAHTFEDVYLGIEYNKIDNNSIKIVQVIENSTGYGLNEKKIQEDIVITQVNNIDINLENKTFKEFIETQINPKVGDSINMTDIEGNQYTLTCDEIPLQDVLVYIGLTHKPFWIPTNIIGRILGGDFPTWLNTQILWTFVFCFSVALFNLMPTAIFDGGRMIKELIDKWVGEKWKKGEKKQLYFHSNTINPGNSLNLEFHNITDIKQCYLLSPKNNDLENQSSSRGILETNTEKKKKKKTINESEYKESEIPWDSIDTFSDGYFDSIRIQEDIEIDEENLIKLEIQYNKDLKKKLKSKIYKRISWGVGLIILLNFIISIAKFGFSLFWI